MIFVQKFVLSRVSALLEEKRLAEEAAKWVFEKKIKLTDILFLKKS